MTNKNDVSILVYPNYKDKYCCNSLLHNFIIKINKTNNDLINSSEINDEYYKNFINIYKNIILFIPTIKNINNIDQSKIYLNEITKTNCKFCNSFIHKYSDSNGTNIPTKDSIGLDNFKLIDIDDYICDGKCKNKKINNHIPILQNLQNKVFNSIYIDLYENEIIFKDDLNIVLKISFNIENIFNNDIIEVFTSPFTRKAKLLSLNSKEFLTEIYENTNNYQKNYKLIYYYENQDNIFMIISNLIY